MTYAPSPVVVQDPFVVHTMHQCCFGGVMSANGQTVATANWPSANLALFFPFTIGRQRTYRTAVWCTGTVTGGQSNIDIGVYQLDGTRLASIGSTAQGASGTTQVASFSAAFTLDAGVYMLAMACDGTDGIIRGSPSVNSPRAAGAQQMASAFPLPSTATFAAYTNAYIPLFGISELDTL